MPKKTVYTTPTRFRSFGHFRNSLSSANALPQLALLAIPVGVITAFVMILFRLFIEVGSDLLLGISSENFETLGIVSRFISPIAGALLIGLLLFRLPSDKREAGVAHVMSKLGGYRIRLPLINALIQFFAGGIALMAGPVRAFSDPPWNFHTTAFEFLSHAALQPRSRHLLTHPSPVSFSLWKWS